jgi:hypothetical protein
MKRNLKLFMLAALALTAFGALSASGAQALSEFTKPTEAVRLTITPDGTTTTAHQVLDAAGSSITCPTVDGEATIAGTGTTFATALVENIEYTGECKFVGQRAYVRMNGCKYDLNIAAAIGRVSITSCNAGKTIEFGIAEGLVCNVTVPEQANLGEWTAHNLNASEVTIETHVTGVTYTAIGSACPETGTDRTNGNYTTGNFILTAEKDNANKEMVAVQVD